MRQDQNRPLIARFYLEMWNRFDKTIFPDILTEDIRFRGSLGQYKNGYAEFGEYVDFIQRAFPDFSNEVEEIISEDDKAFAKLIYRGTHRGEVFGIEPTGDRFNTQARLYLNSGMIGLLRYGYSAIFTGSFLS
jgi:predicted ester cyclase